MRNLKLASIVLVAAGLFYLTACDNSMNNAPGLEDSLELFAGLELIPEAENSMLIINQGKDLHKDAYFKVKVGNILPNEYITNVVTDAWCLEWKKPIRSNNDTHEGVGWYATNNNEKWKPINYLFSIHDELKSVYEDLTYLDIQAVVWTLAGHIGLTPEFNIDELSVSELPSRLRSGSDILVNRDYVRGITSKVLSEYSTSTVSMGGFALQTANDEQDIFIPPPPPPVIDVDTKIFIYFDASGSMNSTLAPLRTMRAQLLKDALLPLYENDSDAYDENVTIIDRWFNERTFNVLNLEGATPPEGNVIALVFQDEAHPNYHAATAGWNENSPRTPLFESDITTFRNRLASFEAGYYRAVIFQVTNPFGAHGANFKRLIESVENGLGNYAGNFGLADRTEIKYVYDVNDGDTPQVYTDLVIDALEDLGFDLTPPTP